MVIKDFIIAARRRTPQQGRSRALVDAMLEAVNRLIAEQGFQLTTNKVADLAGVSVGSVYQYFSSKDSLLRAWVESIIRARTARAREALTRLMHVEMSLYDATAELIDVVIESRRTGAYESWLAAAFYRFNAIEALRAADAELLPVFRDYLHARRHQIRAVDPELAAFVLLNSVRAVLIAASSDDARLRDPRLREELIRLSMAYLDPAYQPATNPKSAEKR